MRKRWSEFLRPRLSLLLTAALVLSLLPLSALATGGTTPTKPDGWPETSWAEAVGRSDKTLTLKSASLTEYKFPTVGQDGTVTYETVKIQRDENNSNLGTKDNPIAISSEEELILFGQTVLNSSGDASNVTTGKYYILDKPAGEGGKVTYNMGAHYMTPLFPQAASGTSNMGIALAFQGTLIGNGATITNARIQCFEGESKYAGGLFSYMVNGTVTDLTVSGRMLGERTGLAV